jgi:hypothetical protein
MAMDLGHKSCNVVPSLNVEIYVEWEFDNCESHENNISY